LQNREAELGPQPTADLCDRIIDFGHSASSGDEGMLARRNRRHDDVVAGRLGAA
jgi:hypothetical protein